MDYDVVSTERHVASIKDLHVNLVGQTPELGLDHDRLFGLGSANASRALTVRKV